MTTDHLRLRADAPNPAFFTAKRSCGLVSQADEGPPVLFAGASGWPGMAPRAATGAWLKAGDRAVLAGLTAPPVA